MPQGTQGVVPCRAECPTLWSFMQHSISPREWLGYRSYSARTVKGENYGKRMQNYDLCSYDSWLVRGTGYSTTVCTGSTGTTQVLLVASTAVHVVATGTTAAVSSSRYSCTYGTRVQP